ncbi:peptide deformylase [Tsukamurella sp. 8F]|uniref:peptide deformylase n=1 Tax=unclassified Tsukamurella TaxID=2633480 RepID=UPI0023B8C1B9|nr:MULTISPECIES: peptide deformylase [unclassified Tsukamurella]MDF0531056.1 peptide deformylase [Tsukamurella sp. 8J]MDF0585477.1 peptide deformylase [Tsukamurella sp. 8F]
MTVLPIRMYPDPVLRTPADEVTSFDGDLARLVDDMMETMRANHGAGLAAPQVGVSRRVFVYECGGRSGHIVNPVWRAVGDEMQTGPEGCLSIPDIREDCTRHMDVVADGFDVTGEPITVEGTEILARCIQHETDHLDGVLFLSRLDPEVRKAAMRTIRSSPWFTGGQAVGA